MPSNSLGTLTLDLIAKIGSFTGPLDKASQEAKKRNAEIAKSFDSLAKGIGTAIGAIPAILTGIVVSSANTAKEISNLSSLAGLSTTEFQKLAAGARSVGIDQEKLADIFKDTNDKVGDFINTGGGALKDFFTNIAPMVGVTADQFKKLNSKDALALYVTSLQKANVSQAEMTFYMEAIANDSTGLVPLLRNNAQGFKDFGDAAEKTGVILDTKTIASAKQFGIEVQGIEQFLGSAKTQLAVEFLPLITQFSIDINQATKDAGGLGPAVKKSTAAVIESIAFIVDAGDGVGRVFKIISAEFDGLVSSASGSIIAGVFQTLSLLDKLPAVDLSSQLKDLEENYNSQVAAALDATNRMRDALEKPLAGTAFVDYYKKANEAAEQLHRTQQRNQRQGVGEGTGSGVDPAAIAAAAAAAKKSASDAESAAKKLQGTFDTTEQAYQRDIELINTSVDARKNATEVAKLQFEIESGKLVGINAEQQKRLLGLAAELDVKKKLKQANEDEAKAAAYAATLAEANQTAKSGFDQELAGAGMGDKARDRLKLDLQIQQDYDRQMADLQKQRNSGDISQELYTKETGQLQEALASRMVIQQDYFNQLDKAQSDWMSGVADAWSNYKDQAADSASQAKELFSDALNGTEDAIVSFIKTGKLSFKDLADSIIEDLIRIQVKQAAVGLLSSAFGLISGGSSALGSSTSSGFSETLTKNAKGGVYDSPSLSSFSNGVFDTPQMFAFAKGAGIFAEAGPEAIMPLTRAADGSLGVRAVGSAGSAAPESAVTGASATGGVTQHITVQGSADDATLARIQQAARQGAQDGYALMLRDLKQNGPARQLINRR